LPKRNSTATKNLDVAKAQADMALAQNPNDQFSMCLMGFALASNDYAAEGQRYSLESLKLSPLETEPCLYAIALGVYFEGNFADAANSFARIPGTFDVALALRAAALWNLGQADAARDAMQRFMALKRRKLAEYPGDDVEKWWSYLLRQVPVADPARLEKLFEGFRNAGLPV
jgi:hypothetical protein